MKKLLTVSVLAIMAVSAANADIASTGYVDKQTGADANGAITYTGKNYINGAENLKAATESLDAVIKGVADKVGTTNVGEQISGAIEAAKVSDLSDGKDYAKTADVVTNTELAELTATKTAAAGQVVTGVTTTGGVVTRIAESKITDAFIEDGTISQAKINGLVTALEGKADDATTLAGYGITDAYTKEETGKQIDDKISDFDSGLTSIKQTVAALPTTYAPINTVEQAEQEAITNAATAITETIGSGFSKDSTVASQLGAVKTTADNAMNWDALKDNSYTAAGCNVANAVCSLVSKGGAISWEKVAE
ncbi:MAG: hypothetical protein R8M37_00295 [Alphaproteobacteria bacterium]|nr:hypothetical protein [Alphaproteobacteria bacterium]